MKKNQKIALIVGVLLVGGIGAYAMFSSSGELFQGRLQLNKSFSITPTDTRSSFLPKIYPKITTDISSRYSGSLTVPSSDTTVHKFRIEAVGNNVRFRNNGARPVLAVADAGTALFPSAANQIVVKMTSSSPIPAGASCMLVRVTGGELGLSTVATVADAAAPFVNYLPFTFDTNQLDVALGAGNAVEVEVRCDTAVIMTPAAPGSTLSFSLPSEANSVEWGTASPGETDLTGYGAKIIPTELKGHTVSKPL